MIRVSLSVLAAHEAVGACEFLALYVDVFRDSNARPAEEP
jgi:hypothetical protein